VKSRSGYDKKLATDRIEAIAGIWVSSVSRVEDNHPQGVLAGIHQITKIIFLSY
jgi:hypothetical protein